MSAIVITLGLALVCGLWWMTRRRPAPPAAARAAEAVPTPPVAAAPVEPELPVATARPVPEPLAKLSLRTVDRLSPDKARWFAEALRDIPRPPSALQQMVSVDYVAQATSSDLADLVMSEPLVAAKVMAKVHSPIYGLREPVTKIGQAMTFIGTTSVRNICLRYLLDESFKSADAHTSRIFESLGEASTLGSELSLRLAQKLQLPDAAGLMTDVLLSFTGHLAATLLQVKVRQGVPRTVSASFLQRVYGQQQELGLSGAEIGRLLMQAWELPAPLVDSVAKLDRVLVTPADTMPPSEAARLAVGYVSARLGERFADGRLDDLDDIDALLDDDIDFHHLQGYLALPALRDLRKALTSPALVAGLQSQPQAQAESVAA